MQWQNFQKAMQDTLGECFEYTIIYIDDIIVFSNNFDEHVQQLRTVFMKLLEKGWFLKLSKLDLIPFVLEVMGHGLTKEGIKMLDNTKEIISRVKEPSDIKGVRSVMGLFSHYRKFIKKFTEITEPINMLVRGESKFSLGGRTGEGSVRKSKMRS